MMDRRKFVVGSAVAAAAAGLRGTLWAQGSTPLELVVNEARVLAQMPKDFVGLSYETQQLNDPTFFAPTNTNLLPFFRTLSKHGVLRLGGNTSANSWWKPTPDSVKPQWKKYRRVIEDGVPSDKLAYSITPEAVVNLKGFLDAAGWRAIYGLNLANGTAEAAADEAAFVAKTLGDRLLYFQVGNEVDLFDHSVRPKGWTVDEYFAEWLPFVRTIAERVPEAKFSAPDVSNKISWVARFGELLAATPNPPTVAAITHHFYVGGPPSNPDMTRAKILRTDEGVAKDGAVVMAAANKVGATARLTESNTCYHGGKPGVSDVFAASLWAANYALSLASMGYSGLNLHGGGGKQVADSLGGKLPGELLLPPGSGWHPSPFYTPIADAEHGGYAAQPVYYGLLLADHFAGCTLVEATIAGAPKELRVFAGRGASDDARLGRIMRVALINTSTDADVTVRLSAKGKIEMERLTASALDARDVRLGGGQVTPTGLLTGVKTERVKGGVVTVPRGSAMLLGWL